MYALDYADLAGLFDRRVVAHGLFESVMLGAQGLELGDVIDTMQLATMTVGCARGVRKLSNIAKQILGVDLPKNLQTSYWAARNLSDAQLAYAAADPVIDVSGRPSHVPAARGARAAGILAGQCRRAGQSRGCSFGVCRSTGPPTRSGLPTGKSTTPVSGGVSRDDRAEVPASAAGDPRLVAPADA